MLWYCYQLFFFLNLWPLWHYPVINIILQRSTQHNHITDTVFSYIFVGISFNGYTDKEMFVDIWICCFDTSSILLLLHMFLWCTKFCGWYYQGKPPKLLFNEQKFIYSSHYLKIRDLYYASQIVLMFSIIFIKYFNLTRRSMILIKEEPRYNWNIVESGIKHHNSNPNHKRGTVI